MIFDLPYIKHPKMVGNLEVDVDNLLSENGQEKTMLHCKKVAKSCFELANRFNLDERIAYSAGILHDISAVIKPMDMMKYAKSCDWDIDESEIKHNFILHQRISAVVTKKYFNVEDKNILSAIECHSTLKANPSEYDMLLFLSDKISWDQDGIPPFYDSIQAAIDTSLMYASLTYINYVLDNGMILSPHIWLIEAKKWLEMHCR